MMNIKLGKIYADAILEYSKKENKVEKVLEMLIFLSDEISKNEDMKEFLDSPVIKKDNKISFLSKLLDENFKDEINIAHYLVIKNRISLLKEIKENYLIKYNEINDSLEVTAIFAKKLTDIQKEKLINKLEKMKNKKIILNEQVDENLIAGGIIKINDEVIDGSLRNEINKLKESF